MGRLQPQGDYNMATTKRDAAWTEINPASLPTEIGAKHAAYKTAYQAMKDARQAFEDAMEAAAELPQGKRMIFGYNFGKLSVAVVDDDRKAKAAPKGSLNLADFLRQQAQGGRNA